MREYADDLTIDINSKGVLDVDVVKGCTMGIRAHGEKGCYQGCYAAAIAKFRGIDFSKSVTRRVKTKAQAKQIEAAVKKSPLGFFRIGTMGDPCHDWDATVETVEWLAPFAVPIIITKHWHKASDLHLRALVSSGAIINTSVSALDSKNQLSHRQSQIDRYADIGGQSIARVVSCDFNLKSEEGHKKAKIQEKIFENRLVIDNPLRVKSSHELVTSGLIKTRKVVDLIAVRDISMPETSKTYVGHCDGCIELCGIGVAGVTTQRPNAKQRELFKQGSLNA